MKRKLVFGMMGCGEIAVQTAKAITETSNCAIGMVQDTNEAMARDMAKQFDAPYCLTWEELLSEDGLDAVYIATPHYLHAPGAVKAAAAGKHVMVEKPIATTLGDADKMIRAARKAGVALSTALAARYSKKAETARKLVRGGAIGKVVGIDFGTYGYKPESYWSGGWTGRVKTDWRASKAKSGGGFFIMNLVHTVDFMRYVTGLEVASVGAMADTFKTKVEVEDYVAAIMRYANGAIGQTRGATFVEGKTPAGTPEGDRIIGMKGQLYITAEAVHLFTSKPYGRYKRGEWNTIATGSPWAGRSDMMSAFAKAVLGGRKPVVTGEDGRKCLEVCLAVYKSAETGDFVRLPMGG